VVRNGWLRCALSLVLPNPIRRVTRAESATTGVCARMETGDSVTLQWWRTGA
jgi:hypothetical protein